MDGKIGLVKYGDGKKRLSEIPDKVERPVSKLGLDILPKKLGLYTKYIFQVRWSDGEDSKESKFPNGICGGCIHGCKSERA